MAAARSLERRSQRAALYRELGFLVFERKAIEKADALQLDAHVEALVQHMMLGQTQMVQDLVELLVQAFRLGIVA